MPTYTVARPLRVLASELTAVAPRRTLPDWFVGDPDHKAGVSDHNIDDTPGWRTEQTDADTVPEVRAVDIRLPLNAPFTPEQFVQWLIRQAREGRLPWLRYVIYKGRIWTRSGGWVTQRYTGSNPHDHHVHVSSLASRDTDSTSPRLASLAAPAPTEDDMDQAQFTAFMANAVRDERVHSVLRGSPWAYNGRGFGGNDLTPDGNISTLRAFDVILTTTRATLEAVQVLTAKLAEGGSAPEAVAILDGIDRRLEALQARIEDDTRDAVADLAEGGAPAVRADVESTS